MQTVQKVLLGVPMVALLAFPTIAHRGGTLHRAPPYHVWKRIIVDSGGAAFLAVDPVNRHLYGVGNKVIDIDRDTIVAALPPRSGRGYVVAPDLKVAISRTGFVIDLQTMQVVRHIDWDGLAVAYDSLTHRVLFIGSNSSDEPPTTFRYAEFDARTGAMIGQGAFPDESQSVVSDDAGHFWAGVAGLHKIYRIDASTAMVTDSSAAAECRYPHALSVDSRHQRLFASCNGLLLVLNASSGRVVAKVPTFPGETKQSAFDNETGTLFQPTEKGDLTLVHEDSPDRFSVVSTIQTIGGSGAAAVDEHTHQVFMFQLNNGGVRVMVLRPDEPR